VSATWIVTEPVERAITVLEQLQPKTQRFLFAVLPSSRHFLNPRETSVKSTTQTNNDLAAFVDWINTYCTSNGRPDFIPLVRNHRWKLTTSQFRRTLAWFIARRPGGETIRRLRSENEDLRRTLRIYAEAIRQLTTRNEELADQLHRQASVTTTSSRTGTSSAGTARTSGTRSGASRTAGTI